MSQYIIKISNPRKKKDLQSGKPVIKTPILVNKTLLPKGLKVYCHKPLRFYYDLLEIVCYLQ